MSGEPNARLACWDPLWAAVFLSSSLDRDWRRQNFFNRVFLRGRYLREQRTRRRVRQDLPACTGFGDEIDADQPLQPLRNQCVASCGFCGPEGKHREDRSAEQIELSGLLRRQQLRADLRLCVEQVHRGQRRLA